MKRFVLFALFVALAGGMAFAQQDMGNKPTAGATYTTGVLESIDSSSLTLRDDANQLATFQIVTATVGAKNHELGTRVRVNFHRNDQDALIADTIQGASGDAETAEVATAPEQTPATYTDSTPTAAPTAQAAVTTPEPETVPDSNTDSDTDSTPSMETSLPHTASPLAAIGLLGLLSLGGALAIRFGN